jgi:chromosome segregation ATPase
MLMIAVLVGILLAAVAVIAWLWFQFKKESVGAQAIDLGANDANAVQAASFLDQQQDEVRRLKDQLKEAQDKEKASEELLIQLGGQVNDLKARLAAVEVSLPAQDDERLAHLRAENVAFREQLDEAVQQLKDFQESSVRSEGEIVRMRAEFEGALEQLRAENAQLKGSPSAGGADVQGLKNNIDELSAKVREFEVAAALQQEKNEYLQYELTKSRAQVVGLERLSGNNMTSGAV